MMAEQVIYARDTRYSPVFQFHSMPTSCVGGGATMPEARATYRAALADALEVDEADLPPITEHVEIPVGTSEVWVRTVVDERGGKQRDFAFRMLQTVIPRLDDVTIKELHTAVAASGVPVIVLVLPDDPMSLILDQMSQHDAIWMAFPTTYGVSWTALYRPEAEGLQPTEDTVLDASQLRDMRVDTFVNEFVRPFSEGADIEIDPLETRRIPRPSGAMQLVIA